MMNNLEYLEKLKKVNEEYTDPSPKVEMALSYIIPILEDFEKRLIELEKK